MKKKKQFLSLAMLATMGTSLVITYPNSVSADQINPIKSTILVSLYKYDRIGLTVYCRVGGYDCPFLI
ncbi:hypothetical protein ACFMB7_33205 (plasmid) [Bacillus toyonensis]